MTSVLATAGSRSHARRDVAALWLNTGAVTAWCTLAVSAAVGWGHPHHAMPGMQMGGYMGNGIWLAGWLLMVVAMMWPRWEMHVASIARRSWRRWKLVSAAVFVGTLTALWAGFGVVTRFVLDAIPMPRAEILWPLIGLGTAMVLSRSMRRARLLQECRPLRAIPPRGSAAIFAAARNGWRSWPRCALLCGPLMAAMTVTHRASLMVGAAVALWWEERHSSTWLDPVPALVLACTTLVFLAGR